MKGEGMATCLTPSVAPKKSARLRSRLMVTLTEREYDTLVLIHAGFLDKEIHGQLGVRRQDVDDAKRSMYRKLGLPAGRQRRILAALMFERGQIPPIGRIADVGQPRHTISPRVGTTPATRPPVVASPPKAAGENLERVA